MKLKILSACLLLGGSFALTRAILEHQDKPNPPTYQGNYVCLHSKERLFDARFDCIGIREA